MPVDQQFIDLLNLSVPRLYALARETGTPLPERRTKWDLVAALAGVSHEELRDRAGDWLYAGQTSVTWIELRPKESTADWRGPSLPLEELRPALRAMYGTDPLDQNVRPERVTTTPQLIDAHHWQPKKVVFTFVVQTRVATVIHNFETVDVTADEFFVAVLRLDRGLLEVRASHARAELLANTWVVELMQHLEA